MLKSKPFDLMDYAPEDFLMQITWVGCLRWAVSTPTIIEQFQEQTGNNYKVPKTALDQMIDEATGANVDNFIKPFLIWFNENIWGDLNIKAGE